LYFSEKLFRIFKPMKPEDPVNKILYT